MELFELMLGEIRLRNMHAVLDGSRIRSNSAPAIIFSNVDFPAPLGPTSAIFSPTIEREVEPVVDVLVAEMLRHAREFDDGVAGTGRLDEIEMNGLFLLRHIDTLDLLKFLDPVLNLFRFRGLIAEFLDERLHMGDFFFLFRRSLAQAEFSSR